MALHTAEGQVIRLVVVLQKLTLRCRCTLVQDSATPYTGTANYTNCYVEANDNSGCTVIDGNSTSYGADFAAAGGGVWVTEFATDGISYVRFLRVPKTSC